ncbi:MAG: hypothetical protein DMF74_07255 [Acidobacteria bacterium]|nr:MAG: hypothetical protein DMF74_07255 [Acidobacteriota bacterium]
MFQPIGGSILGGFVVTSREIINEMKQLSNAERLAIVEEATRLIRQEIAGSAEHVTKECLTSAAKMLLHDYLSDEELTVFTMLDGEEFRSA